MEIQINIANKHATVVGTPTIVCGNSEYTIRFTFDDEWTPGGIKTVRFVYLKNGAVAYTDVVMESDTVEVPILSNTKEVRVGVFEGDLRTTTPAVIPCELSIRCGTGEPEDPTPSQYDQIMALLSKEYALTDEEKDEIAEIVKTEVPLIKTAEQPTFVNSVDECTDPEKIYVLPDGYMYAHGIRYVKQYTNLLPTLTDFGGSLYNGGLGCADDIKQNTETGEDIADPWWWSTGFIPFTRTDVVRLRYPGLSDLLASSFAMTYDENKNKISFFYLSQDEHVLEENGDIATDPPQFNRWHSASTAYIRYSVCVKDAQPDLSTVIVTKNEEIIEGEVEGFFNTGLVYQPMDCEDRIIELEEDVADIKDDVAELKETGGGNVTFDYASYGLPELALTGDVSAMTKENAVTLDYVYGDKSGTCTCKWQGSSSIAYPKKNYTLKFDNAFEAVEGWGEQKKYCMKANWIDHSHARNVVSAKLWGDVVRSRTPENTALSSLPNCGAIDGFPCVITINGKYMGLYTFNIPKDGWMFGMGSGTSEAILCAENSSNGAFDNGVEIGNHFSLEYVTDEDNADWVTTSFNRLINAVKNSDGSDLDTTVAQYLDLDSTIDYYIFVALIGGIDMTTKNYLMVTYDGEKWFFSAYDMDSTYGLHPYGKYFYNAKSYAAGHYPYVHPIMNLMYTYKKDAIKKRYAELRKGALSEANVLDTFSNFVCKIPERIYLSDTEVWPGIPSSAASNLAQIVSWYQTRAKFIDAQMEAL